MHRVWSALAVAIVSTVSMGQGNDALGASRAPAVFEDLDLTERGPVDWGWGPGVRPGSLRQMMSSAAQEFAGAEAPADAHVTGTWSAPFSWPIVAIHTVLVPDGRVMSFGGTLQGKDGASLHYTLWDPARGTGSAAHTVMPNTTRTDIFCGGQTVLPATGEIAVFGGDAAVGGKRHYSNNRLTVFRPSTNDIVDRAPMFLKRWYATAVALADGRVLVLGGRLERPLQPPALTPEILSTTGAWQLLNGATSEEAFGGPARNWYYTRGFATPSGKALLIGHDNKLFMLDPAGNGSVTRLGVSIEPGSYTLPSVMYAPRRVLSLRKNQRAAILDIRGAEPSVTYTSNTPGGRYYANTTVLPTGEVLVTGGSSRGNLLDFAQYSAITWNPVTGTWRTGAVAQKARLYHSTALLLPDGSVLVAGGGAPGPVTNLNAELYYPNYLFKRDGSGSFAPRPTIVSVPQTISQSGTFSVGVGAGQQISKVTVVRTGSATHAFNNDQRYIELSFTRSGNSLSVSTPTDRGVLIPGYYLLFVVDASGVPSIGRFVRVPIS